MNDRLKSVPRVYVVDSDYAVLNTLSRVLRNAGFEVVTYKTAEEFIAHYYPTAPACLVVALHHPEVGGLDLQQWLAQSHDPLPVIFISGYSDIAATVRAMKAGAIDFLSKPVDEQQLLNALDDALLRQRESILKCTEIAAVERRMATLTPREREVLMHVVSGQLNKQIAGDLGTVEKTIKVHRARVMRKMPSWSV
jgi:FixJ family two-component response regulator